MSGGTRNHGAENDVVYRVAMVYKPEYVLEQRQRAADYAATHDGQSWKVDDIYYAAGPYTTPQPARRELKKLLARYPLDTNEVYMDMYIEEGQIVWSRI